MVTVKFGSKSFEVKANKIYTPDGISISEALSTEEVEVKGKKPTLNIKGIGLQSITMSVKLDCRFVNVETELRYWKNTLLGKSSQILMIGSYQIGKMFLTSYSVSDIGLAGNGAYIRATLELSFTEDGAYANSNKINFTSPKKASAVKNSAADSKNKTIGKGATIKPKSGARWYYTAEGALKKTGKSGEAYQKEMVVTYTYSKSGKIVCVNPSGLGWLKVEDVTVVKGVETASSIRVSSSNAKSGTSLKATNAASYVGAGSVKVVTTTTTTNKVRPAKNDPKGTTTSKTSKSTVVVNPNTSIKNKK